MGCAEGLWCPFLTRIVFYIYLVSDGGDKKSKFNII